MDYLDALHTPTATVIIGGESLTVERCPLGVHYRLRDIVSQINQAVREKQIDLIFEYLQLAAGESIDSILLEEITPALNVLVRLNNEVDLLPWQEIQPEEGTRTTADYAHRFLAYLVHTLARAYGWTQEYILSLQPDVVACYLQEVWISEWEEQRFFHDLSPNIFDKNGNAQKYPRPLWYRTWVGPTVEEATGKIPARFMPDGVVKDASEALKNSREEVPD